MRRRRGGTYPRAREHNAQNTRYAHNLPECDLTRDDPARA